MGEGTDRIKAELARQGFTLTDEDMRAVEDIVAEARAGLAKVRLQASDEPDVPCGFLPPGFALQWPPGRPGRANAR